jgi:peptidyl-prolyl cis-trans isomerase C
MHSEYSMNRRFFALLLAFSASTSLYAAEPLVRWRDLALTQEDYQAALQAIPAEQRFEFQTDMKRITTLLENLVIYRTLAIEAHKEGIDKDPMVKREMDLFRERLLATKRLASFEKSIKVPDLTAAAEDRYKANPEKFKVPETIEAAHILVDLKKHGDAATAKARAEEVRAKALAGGDFAELAKEYSDDPGSAPRGGNLGQFTRGRMLKTFEDAAFALKSPGDISDVIETSYGYHVIRLTSHQPEKQLAFDDVKERLLAEAKEQFVNQKKIEFVSAIKNDKTIVLNKEAINKLKLEPQAAKKN